MKRILYNCRTQKFTCPECGSHSIHVKSGLHTELYTCLNCGYESRDLDFEK